ncbi:hypothetical protein K0M31_018333 [Melipona bicolor]|uniref:Uncharacterized protein n=1 Tax=Melipona bicolor TaxID=60889 RepID=A0AA40KRL2_9HYME|nr:hypothetical protein K0M31_018333 [Melipona bicolor]
MYTNTVVAETLHIFDTTKQVYTRLVETPSKPLVVGQKRSSEPVSQRPGHLENPLATAARAGQAARVEEPSCVQCCSNGGHR